LKLSEPEHLTLKTNERLIVNLIEKIIDLGNELLNEEVRNQLTDNYMLLSAQYEGYDSKPMKYLLAKFGYDLSALIEQRKAQNPQL